MYLILSLHMYFEKLYFFVKEKVSLKEDKNAGIIYLRIGRISIDCFF